MDTQELLDRESFIELDARARAKKLLDPGTFSELLDPFDNMVELLLRCPRLHDDDHGVFPCAKLSRRCYPRRPCRSINDGSFMKTKKPWNFGSRAWYTR